MPQVLCCRQVVSHEREQANQPLHRQLRVAFHGLAGDDGSGERDACVDECNGMGSQ